MLANRRALAKSAIPPELPFMDGLDVRPMLLKSAFFMPACGMLPGMADPLWIKLAKLSMDWSDCKSNDISASNEDCRSIMFVNDAEDMPPSRANWDNWSRESPLFNKRLFIDEPAAARPAKRAADALRAI